MNLLLRIFSLRSGLFLLLCSLAGLAPLPSAQAQMAQVVVDIAGTQFGNATPIHVDSGATHLQAATSYDYVISGTVHGTGALGAIYGNGTTLANFLDSISAGSSADLTGTYVNAPGTLPVTVINRTYSGSRNTGFGTFAASLTIKGSANAAGTVAFDVTNVTVTFNGSPLNDKIVFEAGSKLTVGVTQMAKVEFSQPTLTVPESGGMKMLTVVRSGSTTGVAKVKFAAKAGTAKAGQDFRAPSGTLTFASGESAKQIAVEIVDDFVVNDALSFTVTLTSASNAMLGTFVTETVTITDDDISFAAAAGTYHGGFGDPAMPNPAGTGLQTVTVTPTGAFTATLLLAGKSYKVRGQFFADGNSAVLTLSKEPLLTLKLFISLGFKQITTTLNDASGQLAQGIANQSPFTKAVPFDRLGIFNVLVVPAMPGNMQTPASFPTGYGYGKLTVKAPAAVKLVGKLADGSAFTANGVIQGDRRCLIYSPLYAKKGFIIGSTTISTASGNETPGDWNWVKPAHPGDKTFPAGFTTALTTRGERYEKKTPLLNFSTATVTLSDGNLGATLTKITTIDARSVVTITTNPDANKTKLKINTSTGALSGSFTPTGSTQVKTFTGLMLPAGKFGAGFFLGTPAVNGTAIESGAVTFKP